MKDPHRPKIVIVGGGPAGLATALHLAQQAPELAAETLIIEAKSYPRPKLCGGGITVHGEEQLTQMGIQIDVPAFMVDRLVFRLGTRDFAVPYHRAMRVIQRAEFDAAIADAAMRRGLCLHTGERLEDLRTTSNGYTLSTDKATYHTTVVVAADGANSVVRRKLRFKSSESVARLLRILTPIDPARTAQWQYPTAVFDFSCVLHGIQGYMWDFPCYVDGVPTMNRGIFDSRIAPKQQSQPHGHFKRVFANWLNEREINLDHFQLKGHPVRWFNPSSEFSRPHVLLAGDAAGVDALFAEGISYAMEYGAIIAELIKNAFRQNDFSFADYRQRLIQHRLGKLLQRRALVASLLYQYRFPPFWTVFWRLANIAPRWMQQRIGASLALLPA